MLNFCSTCSEKRIRDVKVELERLFQKKEVDLFTCGICCCEISLKKEHVGDDEDANQHDPSEIVKIELRSADEHGDQTPIEASTSKEDGSESNEVESDVDYKPSGDEGVTSSDDEKKTKKIKLKLSKKEKASQKKDGATKATRKARNKLETSDLNPEFIKDVILEGSLTSQNFACKICKKEFKFNACMMKKFCLHLGEHMEQAEIPKTYKCPVCELCFNGFAFVKKHIKDHTDPTYYHCPHPDCTRMFKHKKSVSNHELLVHSDLVDIKLQRAKSCVCQICGAVLIYGSSLRKHMLRHQDHKAFKCDDCGKCFVDKTNLARHRERHNESKQTMCEVCGKTFVLLNELRTHSITHTHERLYQCEYCPYRAKRMGNLRCHIRNIHTQADPNRFKCSICGLNFLSATACTKHEKKHQGGMDIAEALLKPYQCADCGYRATKPSHIRIHRRSHTGEKPFKCVYCERAFTQNGQCKRHMKICKRK